MANLGWTATELEARANNHNINENTFCKATQSLINLSIAVFQDCH